LDLLKGTADRISLILSDAGKTTADHITTFDSRNQPARQQLMEIANQPGSTFALTNRMFNGAGRIGHNKFVVHVDDTGWADTVRTGSTNWTWSGVAGQSNNCIWIDDAKIADVYLQYWKRPAADSWPDPDPLPAKVTGAGQFDALKIANDTPC